MNKYEAKGRMLEAEEELSSARKKRTMLAEQIYQKAPNLMMRHKDAPEQPSFEQAVEEMEFLFTQYKENHQEIGKLLDYIDSLKRFI